MAETKDKYVESESIKELLETCKNLNSNYSEKGVMRED